MHRFWGSILDLSLTRVIYGKPHSLLEPQFLHLSPGNEYSVSCSWMFGVQIKAPHHPCRLRREDQVTQPQTGRSPTGVLAGPPQPTSGPLEFNILYMYIIYFDHTPPLLPLTPPRCILTFPNSSQCHVFCVLMTWSHYVAPAGPELCRPDSEICRPRLCHCAQTFFFFYYYLGPSP